MLRVAEHFELSDVGRARRVNQDSVYARAPLFVVADGMGGAQGGEIASRTAVETFESGLRDGLDAEVALAELVVEANRRIHELSQSEGGKAGMGTTLTAAYADVDGVAIAHVGDSRAYLIRDGELTRLSKDHSLVGELVRQGKLTEEEAEHHPQRNIITRALGPDAQVEPDTLTHDARAGDVFLICSDGLHSMTGEGRIGELVLGDSSLQELGHRLIDAANAAGGRDNISVVLFRIEEVGVAPDYDGEQPIRAGAAAEALEAAGATGEAATIDDGSGTLAFSAITPPTPVATAEPEVAEHDEQPLEEPALEAPAPEDEEPALDEPAPEDDEPGYEEPGFEAVPEEPGYEPEPVAAASWDEEPPRRTAPLPDDAARSRTPPKKRRKVGAGLIVALVLAAIVAIGGWIATRGVFFIGTSGAGAVAIFRGLPYELGGGVSLFETYYVSGVPATAVPKTRRARLLDQRLRSRDDAEDLVRALELGRLTR